MLGTRPLFVRSELSQVLRAFEADDGLAPRTWSFGAGGEQPYDRDALLAVVTEHAEQPLAQPTLQLRRRHDPGYAATLEIGARPALQIELDPGMSAEDRPRAFGLADAIADACRPDWGAAHAWTAAAPERVQIRRPWVSDDERDAALMLSSATLAPIQYYRLGPLGLAMRTYIGPHFVKQLGADRLRGLPLIVEERPWRGFRIDLVREPWSAELPALLQPWRAGMAHLAVAGVLATPRIKDGRLIGIEKGARCEVGG
jgi:hypothetical protein